MGRLGKSAAKKDRSAFPIWLQIVVIMEMLGVAAAALIYVPPAVGFADPKSARLIILHVPCAMMSVLAYVVSMVYAVICLARRDAGDDIKSFVSAQIGFVFTLLATGTGMIFAKTQWGSAWNWDPRETSILMLLIVYAAYFALRSAINAAVRARISACYNILAGLVMPYFVFILPRVLGGLHPSDTLSRRDGLSSEYRIVLGFAMLGLVSVFIWIFRQRVKNAEDAFARKSAR